MPPLSELISACLGVQLTQLRNVGGQHGYQHVTGALADGRSIFAKVAPSPADPGSSPGTGAFTAEANGLRWLAAADGGPRVPEVLGVAAEFLVIELLSPLEHASPRAAHRFGADLARMHAAGAPSFGAPWPGYIASLPLDNTIADSSAAGDAGPGHTSLGESGESGESGQDGKPSQSGKTGETGKTGEGSKPGKTGEGSKTGKAGEGSETGKAGESSKPGGPGETSKGTKTGETGESGETDWGSWYSERRLLPYLRRAHDDGVLSRAEVSLVESVVDRIGALAGPPERPSRIHGDLWSGNVLWSGGRGCLIDPAAHGGHRETDLAMLSLFGAPHLAEIIYGYTETTPLADGWRSRVPLHQLHPLLVHVCLFGGGYASQLAATARAALAGLGGHQEVKRSQTRPIGRCSRVLACRGVRCCHRLPVRRAHGGLAPIRVGCLRRQPLRGHTWPGDVRIPPVRARTLHLFPQGALDVGHGIAGRRIGEATR
jgi:fructosamine-3-kinase